MSVLQKENLLVLTKKQEQDIMQSQLREKKNLNR